MLVLTREMNERIVIRRGDLEIVLTVCDIRGDKVRMGFTAPKDVLINREEIQLLIDAEVKRDG